MEISPTLKVDGQYFFLLRCVSGSAKLHAHLVKLYRDLADVDRIVVDHKESGFTVKEFKDAFDEVDLEGEVRVIAMGPNDEIEDFEIGLDERY